jgi:hypothetical protein
MILLPTRELSDILCRVFVRHFTHRYESREMSLATVLDTETGIGYLQNSDMNDSHDLLEKFTLK